MKFGEYLLKKEKIRNKELEKALKFQSGDFVILGEMAINQNVLNKEQVSDILELQKKQGGFFGDIAVNLGFLKKGELEKRLEIHRERFLIGEKLVSYGAISKEDLEEEFEHFRNWITSQKITKEELHKGLLDYW